LAGVLTKKGKKRFFVLVEGILMWFTEVPGEQRLHSQTTTKVKTTHFCQNSINVKQSKCQT
jgi:hypothetical protein